MQLTQINLEVLCDCLWVGSPGKHMAEDEIIRQEGEGGGGKYRAYLLRCWQDEENGESQWRFTLVEAGDEGVKRGFANLESLTTFLREDLDLAPIHKEPRR